MFHELIDQDAYSKRIISAARVTFFDGDGNEVHSSEFSVRPYDGAFYAGNKVTKPQEYLICKKCAEVFRDALHSLGVLRERETIDARP